jgi:hypothetical protein
MIVACRKATNKYAAVQCVAGLNAPLFVYSL